MKIILLRIALFFKSTVKILNDTIIGKILKTLYLLRFKSIINIINQLQQSKNNII